MDEGTKQVVIDASVVLKWFFRDEEALEQANQMLLDYSEEKLELHAPDLLSYEVSNAFWSAVLKGRLDALQAEKMLSDFRQLHIIRHRVDNVWEDAMHLAFQFQRTFYDSIYIALAKELNIAFYTGDRKLFNSIKDILPTIQWIGDYEL